MHPDHAWVVAAAAYQQVTSAADDRQVEVAMAAHRARAAECSLGVAVARAVQRAEVAAAAVPMHPLCQPAEAFGSEQPDSMTMLLPRLPEEVAWGVARDFPEDL